ncbi:MAG TPA: DegT/DnrJ/EryC1/StrS family aminotransferase [Thermotogota bacterium]|nr:DegT/DnrJ/EryC1/StrS family aminotransferase [Thermotogota bacterium]HRW91686.1 DegT/DnrJ/EryC1/StrS family aminotransferase [Thermotogota bacterium]
MPKTIPLSSPDIGTEEEQLVLSVLRSGILSIGPQVQEFEKLVAQLAGRRFGIAVNSGTSALSLVLKSIGVGEGDFWVTTPFSFVASSNIFLFEGATPVFVDIDPMTLNIDPSALENTLHDLKGSQRIRGILPVDVFGQPADYTRLERLAQEYDLSMVEDSCEAIGSLYKGKPCGGFGIAGTFAFYPNKQITTGEGGMIVTDDAHVAELCHSMRNQGRGASQAWLEHERLGFNFRMDELAAALGVCQVKKLDSFLDARARVAERYRELLAPVQGVESLFIHPNTTRMSWFVYVVILDRGIDRDRVLALLREEGIGCRNYFSPIHLQPLYRKRFGYQEGMFPVTEDISRRTIALPFFNKLNGEEQQTVVHTLSRAIEIAS